VKPAPTVDVSIVVVSYNTRSLLRECLRSIVETVEGITYEIVVVDNGSSDASPQMVAEAFPEAVLIENRDNLGFAAANNQAIRLARGRHILLLNSDAVLLPGAVSCMVRFLDAHPAVGMVGAQLLNPDGSFQASFADLPTLVGEVLLLTKLARLVLPPTYPSYPAERSREPRPAGWVFGACLMARRAAIDDIGPLDETYFMYTEETDWCCRAHKAGWAVYYLPDAKVIHWSGKSHAKAPERRRSLVYRSKWLFFRKHHGRLTAVLFRAAVLGVSALKLLATAIGLLVPSDARRDQARRELRSYRLVLGAM